MKKRFTEEQKVTILKGGEAGVPPNCLSLTNN